MTDHSDDAIEFDDLVAVALATMVEGPAPRPIVKARLMARIAQEAATPAGFAFRFDADDDWQPYSVPGIRMKVLSVNRRSGYSTLLLDVAPGTRFPAHHHDGDEECYVISGSVITLGRRLGPGDFVHADAGTDHAELWTDEGARVLLVVPV
ncbi:MAG TPA: cupin domain-containing protein [Vicinamibacterales bacterium]|jgi:quercetin dioxygenase-like cupin family protein